MATPSASAENADDLEEPLLSTEEDDIEEGAHEVPPAEPAPLKREVRKVAKKKTGAPSKTKKTSQFPAGPKLLQQLVDRRPLSTEHLYFVFVEIVLWASCWGIVDMVVNMVQYHLTSDAVLGSILCMVLYGLVVVGGSALATIPIDIPIVHPKVIEFASLVLRLAGAWGVVDSLASLLARGTALLVLFWYLFFALVASLVLTWHHLQSPNELLDRLVLA